MDRPRPCACVLVYVSEYSVHHLEKDVPGENLAGEWCSSQKGGESTVSGEQLTSNKVWALTGGTLAAVRNVRDANASTQVVGRFDWGAESVLHNEK